MRMATREGEGAGVELLEMVEAMVTGEAGSEARWRLTARCDGRGKAGGTGIVEWETSEGQSWGEGGVMSVKSRCPLNLIRLWGWNETGWSKRMAAAAASSSSSKV